MPELTNVAMPSNGYLFIKIYHRTHGKDSNQLFCIRISAYSEHLIFSFVQLLKYNITSTKSN